MSVAKGPGRVEVGAVVHNLQLHVGAPWGWPAVPANGPRGRGEGDTAVKAEHGSRLRRFHPGLMGVLSGLPRKDFHRCFPSKSGQRVISIMGHISYKCTNFLKYVFFVSKYVGLHRLPAVKETPLRPPAAEAPTPACGTGKPTKTERAIPNTNCCWGWPVTAG